MSRLCSATKQGRHDDSVTSHLAPVTQVIRQDPLANQNQRGRHIACDAVQHTGNKRLFLGIFWPLYIFYRDEKVQDFIIHSINIHRELRLRSHSSCQPLDWSLSLCCSQLKNTD